jgi:hypothetical protein
MKTQAQTKRITELIESAKQQFGDFSEVKKPEIFLTIKEAKASLIVAETAPRPMLKRLCQRHHLLRIYATDISQKEMVDRALLNYNGILPPKT